MADDAQPQASSSAESPAQEKARLRRERRAAKIQAGGAARLQAITSLQGGPSHRDVQKDVPARTTSSPSPALAVSSPSHAAGTATPDPEEVDISTQQYSRVPQPRQPSPFAYNDTATPLPGAGLAMDPSQDPMMAMLQSMMGSGASSIPGAPSQTPQGMPPGLAEIMGAMQGNNAPQPSPEQSSAWIWRLIHSVFSLGLAIYIVLQTPFTGSKLARSSLQEDGDWSDDSPAEAFRHFFYMFATFEVVLQTSRYYIEKGQLQGKGILSSIAQFLPEPYAGYVRVVGRYSVIYSTVVSDAMVVVFVLGAASWWNGGAA